MKLLFSHRCQYLVLLAVLLIVSSTQLVALSKVEVDQLLNNNETYIYCDKKHSKMVDVIQEISKFEEDQQSPVCQLYDHIQKGFSIGRQDAVSEALAYAEQSLQRNHKNLSDNQINQIQATLNSVIDAVVGGKLTIDVQSLLSEHFRNCSIDQND